MQLRNGTNTISEARVDAAEEALRDAQWDEQMRAAAGRTEEMPTEMADRHSLQWQQLREDYQNLSVQGWVKRYPDPPDIKQREGRYREVAAYREASKYDYRSEHQQDFELDIRHKEAQFQQAISGPVSEIKKLSDDVLIDIWERREHVSPAIVRAAAHELERSFPGFHATPSLGNKLTTEKNYEAAASSFAASEHRHNAGRTSFWSSEISAGKALREQQPQHQEQAQKVRQQQM